LTSGGNKDKGRGSKRKLDYRVMGKQNKIRSKEKVPTQQGMCVGDRSGEVHKRVNATCCRRRDKAIHNSEIPLLREGGKKNSSISAAKKKDLNSTVLEKKEVGGVWPEGLRSFGGRELGKANPCNCNESSSPKNWHRLKRRVFLRLKRMAASKSQNSIQNESPSRKRREAGGKECLRRGIEQKGDIGKKKRNGH